MTCTVYKKYNYFIFAYFIYKVYITTHDIFRFPYNIKFTKVIN